MTVFKCENLYVPYLFIAFCTSGSGGGSRPSCGGSRVVAANSAAL
jgi:hypothetical protein